MAEDQRSREVLEQAAEGGDVDAMYALGLLLVDDDRLAATTWFELAAKRGQQPAMKILAALIVDQDREASKGWFARLGEAGDVDAMNRLGVLLLQEDREKARRWFERAARSGDSQALRNLDALERAPHPMSPFDDTHAGPGWLETASSAFMVKRQLTRRQKGQPGFIPCSVRGSVSGAPPNHRKGQLGIFPTRVAWWRHRGRQRHPDLELDRNGLQLRTRHKESVSLTRGAGHVFVCQALGRGQVEFKVFFDSDADALAAMLAAGQASQD